MSLLLTIFVRNDKDMWKVIDRVGEKFNKWTVLEFHSRTKNGEAVWLCQCDCGTKQPVVAGNLTSNGSRQCLQCSFIKNYKDKTIPTPVWKTITANAARRNKKFLISRKFAYELFEQQQGVCAISGLPIRFADSNKDYVAGNQTASLDRIDSTKNYTRTNVQWVHKNVNLMKNNMTEVEFLNYCKSIVNYQNR